MDEILDLIYEAESSSGRDKKAYVPHPESGALGGYQIKRSAFRSIQKMFPDKWKDKTFKSVALDDKQAREAARDIFRFNTVSFPNDYKVVFTSKEDVMDALVMAYKEGVGGVLSTDPEVVKRRKDYLNKIKSIRSRYTEQIMR